MSLDFGFVNDWANAAGDWLFGTDTDFGYSSDDIKDRWKQQNVYGQPGTLGSYYQQSLQSQGQAGYGPSVAAVQQKQALGQAQTLGAAAQAARAGHIGGTAALQAGLNQQEQAAQQAVSQYTQQRQAEQSRAQGDYLNYLQSATKEQIAQDRINAAYSALNLEAKIAEQEARRKVKGGIFGALGSAIGSIADLFQDQSH